ncbi:MAG: DEAD/DEAH box helicase, partial [Paraclostridium sp.]
IPKDLNAKLRDYQVNGFKWFKSLSHYEFGGILADEMGLGKTIQTITFLLSNQNKKSIIITPTSLVHNWKHEFDKFAPSLKLGVVHGDKKQREHIIENYKDYDVILTTYGTVKNDLEKYLTKIFDYCIIDEAQNIKNPDTLISKSIKSISAKSKFALTGTPIENNLIELWSIFDFIMPGYLYNKTKFQNIFINNDVNIKKLRNLIKPFVLRRTKKDVMKELPNKIEKKFFVELNKEQQKIYNIYNNSVLEKMKVNTQKHDKITIFSYLTKLRQLCLDPSVILKNYTGRSTKMDITLELLKEAIDDNRKVLLFSQYTKILNNIGNMLQENGITYSYLDGKTKAQDRVKLVDEFNNNKNNRVFLISLKAGGTGLNLTSADMVIHFDPWWNPAVENQASDRAHRFGQKNIVEVIKLISKDTIEEKIIQLQKDKKELIENMINGDLANGNILNGLTKEELVNLFK